MKDDIFVLPEPRIQVGNARRVTDPHAGLSLFGPYGKHEDSHPSVINYAVIGTENGISKFFEFSRLLQRPIFHDAFHREFNSLELERLWPPFPGFSTAFESKFPQTSRFVQQIPSEKINSCVFDLDQHKRVFEIVNLFLEKIRLIAEREEDIRVIACVVPDIIWSNCRPQSSIREGGTGMKVSRREAKLRQQYGGDLFSAVPDGQYDFSVDFRRQLKARSMEFGIPIQLIRESTLSLSSGEDERELTPVCDLAWNLSTALYYKAGGKPWKLADAREGVCYIGLAFKQATENSTNFKAACCAAQMFLDTGDGIVFRGEYGPWYSEKMGFHLSREAAKTLLEGVLRTYKEQEGRPLREVFLHSRSGFCDEELAGYRDACGVGVKLVGIRVGQTRYDIQMFRNGKWCVQRGTIWIQDEQTAYLWASGFKPELLTYDGWEIPVPIQIKIQYGDADILQVSRDILALTKLNYNACKVGDSLPVTVLFSDRVGEILTSNRRITRRYPKFKFYI